MPAHAVKPKLASGQKTSVDAIRIDEVAHLVADLHQERSAANDDTASVRLEGGFNTYLYAKANPLTYVDPDGRNAAVIGGLIFGGTAAVIGGALDALGPLLNLGDGEQCDEDDDQCEYQYYKVDIPVCRGIGRTRGAVAAARCYQSAAERYAACRAGRLMPDLDTYNN